MSSRLLSYEYVALRCVPRVDRDEFINVGVVIHSQAADFLDCAFTLEPGRLRSFSPHLDLRSVEATLKTLCTICRELPNFSLAGFWWHNFFPGAIRHVMTERLDMVPVNKQAGFFSDAYAVEWSYAKAFIVRKQMAQVLAGKVAQGQYTFDEAVNVAREILFETPQSLCGMTPVVGRFRR